MTIYQDTDIITDDMARELMKRGACSIALLYVGCTVGEAAKKNTLPSISPLSAFTVRRKF